MAWLWQRRTAPADPEPLGERVRALEAAVRTLTDELVDLHDKYRRRAARMRKHDYADEEAGAADAPAPSRRNGTLPTIAQLRAAGRLGW